MEKLTINNFNDLQSKISKSYFKDENFKEAYQFIVDSITLIGNDKDIDEAVDMSLEYINNKLGTETEVETDIEPEIEKPKKAKKEKKRTEFKEGKDKIKKEKKEKIKKPKFETDEVENIDMQVNIINRYVKLDGKTINKATIIRLLNSLQKAVRTHFIRKTGKYSKQIEYIQSELLDILSKINNNNEFTFKLDAKDKEVLLLIAKSEKVMTSIAIIKSFILIQGKTGEKIMTRAKNLLKRCEKIDSNNIYFENIKDIKNSLKDYISNKTDFIKIPYQQLNGLYGICKKNCNFAGTKNYKKMSIKEITKKTLEIIKDLIFRSIEFNVDIWYDDYNDEVKYHNYFGTNDPRNKSNENRLFRLTSEYSRDVSDELEYKKEKTIWVVEKREFILPEIEKNIKRLIANGIIKVK